MRKGVISLSLLLILSLVPAYSATPPKAGSVCTKQGVTKTYQGKKYTCIKSGKKLVWNKGMPTPRSFVWTKEKVFGISIDLKKLQELGFADREIQAMGVLIPSSVNGAAEGFISQTNPSQCNALGSVIFGSKELGSSPRLVQSSFKETYESSRSFIYTVSTFKSTQSAQTLMSSILENADTCSSLSTLKLSGSTQSFSLWDGRVNVQNDSFSSFSVSPPMLRTSISVGRVGSAIYVLWLFVTEKDFTLASMEELMFILKERVETDIREVQG